MEKEKRKSRRAAKRSDAMRCDAMRQFQDRARRARLRSSLLCPPQQVSPAMLPQSSLDEDLLTSAEEMSQNERRKLIMSDEEQDLVNRLGEV
jgi:hypothetical protein